MSSVPVSNKDLDEVIYKVAVDLIEDKAVNGNIGESGIDEKLVQDVVKDVVFIVERYMGYINELMDADKLKSAHETQINFE